MKKHPRISSREELPLKLEGAWVMGYANQSRKEMWVFVDEIAIYYRTIRKIMKDIVATTVHELIHLNGIVDETMTDYGEDMVMREWRIRQLTCIVPTAANKVS